MSPGWSRSSDAASPKDSLLSSSRICCPTLVTQEIDEQVLGGDALASLADVRDVAPFGGQASFGHPMPAAPVVEHDHADVERRAAVPHRLDAMLNDVALPRPRQLANELERISNRSASWRLLLSPLVVRDGSPLSSRRTVTIPSPLLPVRGFRKVIRPVSTKCASCRSDRAYSSREGAATRGRSARACRSRTCPRAARKTRAERKFRYVALRPTVQIPDSPFPRRGACACGWCSWRSPSESVPWTVETCPFSYKQPSTVVAVGVMCCGPYTKRRIPASRRCPVDENETIDDRWFGPLLLVERRSSVLKSDQLHAMDSSLLGSGM